MPSTPGGLLPVRLLPAAWASLVVTAGPAAAAALDSWSSAPRTTAALGLWAAWGLVLLATLVPRPAGLSAVRVGAGLATLLALAATTAASGAQSALALTGTVAVAVLAGLPAVGAAFVNRAAYGEERRFLLRLPPALLLGPLPLAVPLLGLGIAAGPLLIADGRAVAGVPALVAGWPVAAGLARSLVMLSQRWAVLVPAGIVLKDPLALVDPVLFPRERVTALRPLPYPTSPAADVLDLRLGAVAGSVLLELAGETTLVRTAVRRRQGEVVRTQRLAFSARQVEALLAESIRRRIASAGL